MIANDYISTRLNSLGTGLSKRTVFFEELEHGACLRAFLYFVEDN